LLACLSHASILFAVRRLPGLVSYHACISAVWFGCLVQMIDMSIHPLFSQTELLVQFCMASSALILLSRSWLETAGAQTFSSLLMIASYGKGMEP